MLKQFGVFLLFSVLSLHAEALGVSPTLIALSPLEPVANLTLTNESASPVVLDLQALKWQQKGEKDLFSEDEDLIVTPPLFTIPPFGQQIVRLGLENPAFGKKEQAYRLFIQEVASKFVTKTNGLNVVLNISLPVILRTATAVEQRVLWRFYKDKDNKPWISATNQGNNVVFINKLQGFNKKGVAEGKTIETFTYLLPGSTKNWPSLGRQKPVTIKASVNDLVVFGHVG